MEDDLLGLKWWHYKGKHYRVMYEALMKIGDSWQAAIVYQSVKDNAIYVRGKKDFTSKFKTTD